MEVRICSGTGVSRGLSAVNAVSKYFVSKVCSRAGLKGGSSCLLSNLSHGNCWRNEHINCFMNFTVHMRSFNYTEWSSSVFVDGDQSVN